MISVHLYAPWKRPLFAVDTGEIRSNCVDAHDPNEPYATLAWHLGMVRRAREREQERRMDADKRARRSA